MVHINVCARKNVLTSHFYRVHSVMFKNCMLLKWQKNKQKNIYIKTIRTSYN